jgi:hypothetical protein
MVFHPTGITVAIVGTESPTQGRSCDEHIVCGSLLCEGNVVRFRKVQVVINGEEQSAMAVYLVLDGINRCRVGFLPRHLLKHWKRYEGVLLECTSIYLRP